MKRLWRRRGEHSDIEQRLRDERPEPSDDLVSRVAEAVGESRNKRMRRAPIGLAYSVTGLFIAAIVALGAFGSPVSTLDRVVSFDNARSNGPNIPPDDDDEDEDDDDDEAEEDDDDDDPADDEYKEKVTICHRPPGNPQNARTLRLPRPAAEAHLRNHPLDTPGPCPDDDDDDDDDDDRGKKKKGKR
jgi:hypothetical protein